MLSLQKRMFNPRRLSAYAPLFRGGVDNHFMNEARMPPAPQSCYLTRHAATSLAGVTSPGLSAAMATLATGRSAELHRPNGVTRLKLIVLAIGMLAWLSRAESECFPNAKDPCERSRNQALMDMLTERFSERF